MMQIVGLSTGELEDTMAEAGESTFRGRQIADWVYRKGATSWEEMTNLSRPLRTSLAQKYSLDFPSVAARYVSSDGSTKLLLELNDRERIETVYLPYKDRVSVCVSSQAGCAMACSFCATGLGGFRRNLTTSEIISQPLLAMRESKIKNPNAEIETPTHIVFMGMGEPLLNLQNVLKTIALMHDEMGIAMRHITVSTVGIIPGIKKLADEKLQLTLAVSLHAPDDELRQRLIPTSAKTHVREIVDAAREYVTKTGRRVTFEYVVLGGVNDDAQRAQKLAKLCKGWPCHVNLIPWNAVPDAKFDGAIFHAPAKENLRRFRETLERNGVATTQRVQRGADVAAACGQLRAIETPRTAPAMSQNLIQIAAP
jgi:23S rRNA (adenine2503-C2)-methyltransferase